MFLVENKIAEDIKNIAINENIEVIIEKNHGFLIVYTNNPEKVQVLLLKLPRVLLCEPVIICEEKDMLNEALKTAKDVLREGDEFAICVHKKGESHILEPKIGDVIFENIDGIKVNLKNPDKELNVRISEKTYIYWKFKS
jgi:adenylyl- and sulfurtransferase ThiI